MIRLNNMIKLLKYNVKNDKNSLNAADQVQQSDAIDSLVKSLSIHSLQTD